MMRAERNVALKDLPALLREDLRPQREAPPRHLYALLDMARIQGELRTEVTKKLRHSATHSSLHDDPNLKPLKEHGALLIAGLNRIGWKRDDALLLNEWGMCNGDVVSAWIVSELDKEDLAQHLRQTLFAYDTDESRYLLRYYDPLTTPVLHRLADTEWKDWFFAPMVAWWYPVATPVEETWSRIAGGGESESPDPVPLVFTEELWDALSADPFPCRVLNILEQMFPKLFASDCFGVRLAKIESLLEAGKKSGLTTDNDLLTYALALFEEPGRVEEPRWQKAVRMAAVGEKPLNSYFPQDSTEPEESNPEYKKRRNS